MNMFIKPSNKYSAYAAIISVILLLTACGGSSSKSSSATEKELTPLEKSLLSGDASLVSEPTDFARAGLSYINQQDQFYHSDIQQLLNLNNDGSVKQDGSSLTDISWDLTHDSAQINAQFGFNAPLLLTNATHNDDSEVGTPSSRHWQ
jgi:hypothetical protein